MDYAKAPLQGPERDPATRFDYTPRRPLPPATPAPPPPMDTHGAVTAEEMNRPPNGIGWNFGSDAAW